jgi:hypothetical protein
MPAVAGVLLVALAGCGGEARKPAPENPVPEGWTPASQLSPAVSRDTLDLSSRRKAEGLVKHQRNEHCGQHLVAVRCSRTASGWLCRWKTTGPSGTTRFPRRFGSGGIPVHCA